MLPLCFAPQIQLTRKNEYLADLKGCENTKHAKLCELSKNDSYKTYVAPKIFEKVTQREAFVGTPADENKNLFECHALEGHTHPCPAHPYPPNLGPLKI